jgi:hypothetical protein
MGSPTCVGRALHTERGPMPRKLPPVPVPAGAKFCFRCNTVHPFAAFAVDRSKPDGHRPMCRDCDSARRLRHYHSPEQAALRASRGPTAPKAATASKPAAPRAPRTPRQPRTPREVPQLTPQKQAWAERRAQQAEYEAQMRKCVSTAGASGLRNSQQLIPTGSSGLNPPTPKATRRSPQSPCGSPPRVQ